MSDVDNPARDLAATGTPGPWRLDGLLAGQVWLSADCARTIGYTTRATDAEKAARAVNALPAIADLLDATRVHDGDDFCAVCPQPVHIDDCPIAIARDRVAAALTGDAS